MPQSSLPELPKVPAGQPVCPLRFQLMEPGRPGSPPPPLPARPDPTRTQGRMPALPSPRAWASATGPSAKIVQKAYVDTRLKELGATNGPKVAKALELIEQMLLEEIPAKKRPRRIRDQELQRIYRQIEANLQAAELTCNFKAEAWFAKENPYDTYTQMYQRAVEKGDRGDVMVLRDTPQNQANTRAGVDNNVTFPKTWARAGNAAPATRGRSLGPQGPDPSRIRTQMDTGTLKDVRKAPTDLAAWEAQNRSFNPNTKQIFLALNYGRRPHGSSTNYGFSYFVAKSDLKPRCLYYSRDTFHSGTLLNVQNYALPLINEEVDADLQVPFATLGAILGSDRDVEKAKRIRADIFASCYRGQRLPDITVSGAHAEYLLEAHHFGSLDFSKDVAYMVISPKELSDLRLWPQIVSNAKTFTKRNGIQLFQTD